MFGYIKKQLKNLLKDEESTTSKSSKGRDVSKSVALTDEEKEQVLDIVKVKRTEELNHSPTIAIIGKTGVGKSSTINSLFNTNLGVSHFESCTQKATPITISNGKGKILIYDMPGLGEDEEKDEDHKIEYKRVLPTCDVVLWIMNIADREMSSQQGYIKHIMTYLEGRLVICANKADMVHPEDWNTTFNIP
jgi:small GTP-binding protein